MFVSTDRVPLLPEVFTNPFEVSPAISNIVVVAFVVVALIAVKFVAVDDAVLKNPAVRVCSPLHELACVKSIPQLLTPALPLYEVPVRVLSCERLLRFDPSDIPEIVELASIAFEIPAFAIESVPLPPPIN